MSVADIWRVSLVTLSPSEAGPGRFGRQLYFTIALSLLCANPHLHVRATTREAADWLVTDWYDFPKGKTRSVTPAVV